MSVFHLPALRFIFLPLSFCLLPCLTRKRETERERQKDDRAKSRNGIGKSTDSANQGDILKTGSSGKCVLRLLRTKHDGFSEA